MAILLSVAAYGQLRTERARGGEVASSFSEINVKKDFYNGYKKVVKKSKKAGLICGALHFKKITTSSVLLGKGQGRQTVKSWAILEGVSDQTMQEIADEFAVMFNKKIEAIGIETVDWSTVSGTKGFAKVTEKQNRKERTSAGYGHIVVKTANDGPYNRALNFNTAGLYKKVGKEIGGEVMGYDIIVDFARFDIDAKRWRSAGYGPGYDFVTTNTSANVLPQVSIDLGAGSNGLTNSVPTNVNFVDVNGGASLTTLLKNIYLIENYATDIDSYKGQMPAAIKKGLQINTKTTGTFVVKADEAKYKELVLKALDQYSDLIIKHFQSEIRK